MTLLERVNEKLERWYDELERQANERGMERGLKQGIEQGIERGIEQGVAQARERALAEERELLRRMAERRFGAAGSARVGVLLDETSDSDGFAFIGDAIVDCTTSDELAARLKIDHTASS